MEQEERHLAALLWRGTWIASALLAAGLLLSSLPLMRGGIALLILLPVLRVALMSIQFLIRRDFVYAAVALLVLSLIATGVALGLKGG